MARRSVLDIVFSNLDSAVENGFGPELLGMTPQQLVDDLRAYAEDCEELDDEEMLPHATAWLEQFKSES